MKIAFYTLGCKVNNYETEKLVREFIAAGFDVVPFNERADVYVVNTCTVTSVSGGKSRRAVSRARKANPEAIVAVMGCYSELDKVDADIVRGTGDRDEIFNDVMEKLDIKAQKLGLRDVDDKGRRTRVSIKIQDGCANFCAYCIIPYARGREVFRSVDEVLAEVEGIEAEEVVLVGIHVSSHPNLREIVEKLPFRRVRLGSLEPHDIDGEFIKWAAGCEKLCPHFHLSLQSGCDSVLARMGRKYTFEEYYEKVKLLREAVPGCSITTDVIVGFVGESDEEFKIGLENVKKCGFAKVHVFPFSVRERTLAADREYIDEHGGLVEGGVKKARADEMMKVTSEMRAEFLRSAVGSRQYIVWEKDGPAVSRPAVGRGYTGNYIRVKCVGEFDVGELVEVEIIGLAVGNEECVGRVV